MRELIGFRLWVIGMLLVALTACSEKPNQALGTLEWDRVNGRAIASETIVEVYVKEGQMVEKGQSLVELDSGMQQAHVNRAQGDVAQAQWKLNELERGYRTEKVAAAEAELNAASVERKTRKLEYDRQKEVFRKGLTSEKKVDETKNRYFQSLGKEKAARENLNQLRAGYREEEVEQAKAQLAAAQSELDYQQTLLEQYTVKAERPGLVDSLPFKLGDKPPAGAVLSTLLAGESPWARVYLPQTWLSQVKVGDRVDVYVDGVEKAMTGKIRHIESDASFTPYYSLAEQNRKRLSFVTEVDLVGSEAASLPVGIPVQVELLHDSH